MINSKNSTSLEEILLNEIKTVEDISEFLNASLELYLEDGDFSGFYRSLEYVIKAKDNISSFSQKTKISRTTLYDIFKGKKEPKIRTLAKILAELGYSLKVA